MSKLFISENKFTKTRVPLSNPIKFAIVQNETIDDEAFEDNTVWLSAKPSRYEYPVTGSRKELLAMHEIYISINESVGIKITGQELLNLHNGISNLVVFLNTALEKA